MFWVGAALTLLMAAAFVLLLYARGIAVSESEPYWATVKALALQIVTGRFW